MTDSVAPASSPGSGRVRHVWRALAELFVAAVVVVPFALINRDFSVATRNLDGALQMLLWLCALAGISLLFLQVLTGAFRPVLRRVFAPRALNQFHKVVGLAGFGFVIGHFLFLLPSIRGHWAAFKHGFFVLGPVALFVLAITVATALMLGRLGPRTWIRLHILNYGVFVVGAVHGLAIGTQTHTLAARLIFAFYLALAAAGFVYRASSPAWRSRLALTFTKTGDRT
jgi:hypothetical protein